MIEKDKYSKTYSSNEWFNKAKKQFNNKYNIKSFSLIKTKNSLISPSGEFIKKSLYKQRKNG